MDLSSGEQDERMKRRRRRKRRRERREWVAPEIPENLLVEILLRLPAKSVISFKRVSKAWLSLFSSRYFCNRFLMLHSTPQPRLYMSLLDCRNNRKSQLLSTPPTALPTTCFEFDQGLTVPVVAGFDLRVVRGFLCCTLMKRAVIYNPCTGQLVILPPLTESSISDHDNIYHFLCYDSVTDQYKVLCSVAVVSEDEQITSELWVYLVEAGGFWKRVAKDLPHHLINQLELSVNGFLYYLVWTDSRTCLLLSFNVSSEEFDTMPLPRKAGDVSIRGERRISPIEYGGKVAVFDFTSLKKTWTVDLWIAQDWMKKEWSMKTLALQPSQMHLVSDYRLMPKSSFFKDKIILVPLRLTSPCYFLCYDLLTNDLKKVDIKGVPKRWFSKHHTTMFYDIEFMDLSHNLRHLYT